jgi:hypothetical protein
MRHRKPGTAYKKTWKIMKNVFVSLLIAMPGAFLRHFYETGTRKAGIVSRKEEK